MAQTDTRDADGNNSDTRPRRTREHIIAELSILQFCYLACRAGHVTQVPKNDYGYDLILYTHRANGERENGQVYIQFKATDKFDALLRGDDKQTIAYPVETRHLNLWREAFDPVVLIVFDAQTEIGYWLYVQQYLQTNTPTQKTGQVTVTLYIRKENKADDGAITALRTIKNKLLDRLKGLNIHE